MTSLATDRATESTPPTPQGAPAADPIDQLGLEPLIDPARLAEPAEFEPSPGCVRLNHASYGLCPRVVRDARHELQRRLDADSVRYFKVDHERYCDRARTALGNFTNARPQDLALVTNGTVAMAACIRAVAHEGKPLGPGDEILLTDHEYMATFNEVDRLCRLTGAKRVVAPVDMPGATPDAILTSILERVNKNTRLVIASHIASASGLIFPVSAIVSEMRELWPSVPVLIDGAHGPGHIPIDLGVLRPTFYAASCHKWLGTSKGTGFVYVDPAWQSRIEPVAMSCRVHAKRPDRAPFLCDFDYVGTADQTANLVIPEAIAHLQAQLSDGLPGVQQRNRELVRTGTQLVIDACAKAGIEIGLPVADEFADDMLGCMIALPLPTPPGGVTKGDFYDDALWDRLYARGVQAPVWDLPGVHPRLMRLSAHLANSIEDFEALAAILPEELAREA